MSTQMTVRMTAESTEHIDALVGAGTFDSRAAYLNHLVAREVRRQRAWADIKKMRAEGTLHDPELDAIGKATSGRSLAHLD